MTGKRKVWPEGMRGCARCGQVKPLANFSPGGNYFQSCCKECRNKSMREWRKAHPEKVRESARRYRAKHLMRVRMRERTYHRRNKERFNRRFRERYHTDPVFRKRNIDKTISYKKANRRKNVHKRRDNTLQAYREVLMLREEYEAYFRERAALSDSREAQKTRSPKR